MPFAFPLLGYALDSLPFAIWATRPAKGVDVRDAGSGHATTTNTIRQAGFEVRRTCPCGLIRLNG